MKIIAHTPQGVFTGKEIQYTEEHYKDVCCLLKKLPDLKYFCFETPNGEVYVTEQMISQSVFEVVK